MTVPSDDLMQIGWTNQKFYRYPKVKRIQHHHTSFKTNAKGTSLERKHKKKKRIQKQTQNNKVKGKRIIYIITLNLNRLNAPTKWHTLAEWKQKQELYAVYKRPTSDWEWGTEKIPCKRKTKENTASILASDKNRLLNKDHYKRQGRTLHNHQGIKQKRNRSTTIH